MSFLSIAVLAVIQGLAELLPVSSSAHVVVAEKLMGLDPSAPEMTFLLVMLHTGTTVAVIAYFWPRWKSRFVSADSAAKKSAALGLLAATAATGVVGLVLKQLIEHFFLRGAQKSEIEALFSNLPLIAAALAAAGVLIIAAGGERKDESPLNLPRALAVGVVQGLCLPFRGFSRSGATISTALLCGIPRAAAEDFSFALAVILTPPVLAREGHRLLAASAASGAHAPLAALFLPGLAGMVFSALAGLAALRWLSSWLEKGRWRWFGYYCLAASAAVFAVSTRLR